MRKGRSNEAQERPLAGGALSGGEREARRGKTSGASWKKGLESRAFYDLVTQGALQPYVRPAQFANAYTQHVTASRFLVLRPAGLRAGAEAALRERSRLCRARADGAEYRRLSHPRLDGPRESAGPERERHRAPLERVPPPPGDPARRPGQRAQHRLPAAPLDLRHGRRAPGRASLSRESLPELEQDEAPELPLHAVRGPARRRGRPRRILDRRPVRLLGIHARPRPDHGARATLENLHRGLPRGRPCRG